MGVKQFNYVVERELVFCEFTDFNFLRHAKFSFVQKLEKFGCMGVFKVSDKVYPQSVCLFYANFEKEESKGWGRTYYTTKVKDTSITPTTAFIERFLI